MQHESTFDAPPWNAITREKHIKAWQRGWKIRLIERMNPRWRDLYEDLNR